MSKKRPLTSEELEAAARLAEAITASNKSQTAIGEAVGVSQGQIWQWANGRLPVPAARAAKLAREVGLRPHEISPAWTEAVGNYWPFDFEYKRFARLTSGQKIRIEGALLGEIVDIENGAGPPCDRVKKSGAGAA